MLLSLCLVLSAGLQPPVGIEVPGWGRVEALAICDLRSDNLLCWDSQGRLDDTHRPVVEQLSVPEGFPFEMGKESRLVLVRTPSSTEGRVEGVWELRSQVTQPDILAKYVGSNLGVFPLVFSQQTTEAGLTLDLNQPSQARLDRPIADGIDFTAAGVRVQVGKFQPVADRPNSHRAELTVDPPSATVGVVYVDKDGEPERLESAAIPVGMASVKGRGRVRELMLTGPWPGAKLRFSVTQPVSPVLGPLPMWPKEVRP